VTPDPNQISIKDAIAFTGRSERTIRRLLKTGHIAGQKTKGVKGDEWLIDKESLIKAFQMTGMTGNMDRQKTGHDNLDDRTDDNPIIMILQKQLDEKQQQLIEKDKQIENLHRTIQEMIERDRESNIIIKSQQEQLKLLENKQGEKKKGLLTWIKDLI